MLNLITNRSNEDFDGVSFIQTLNVPYSMKISMDLGWFGVKYPLSH